MVARPPPPPPGSRLQGASVTAARHRGRGMRPQGSAAAGFGPAMGQHRSALPRLRCPRPHVRAIQHRSAPFHVKRRTRSTDAQQPRPPCVRRPVPPTTIQGRGWELQGPSAAERDSDDLPPRVHRPTGAPADLPASPVHASTRPVPLIRGRLARWSPVLRHLASTFQVNRHRHRHRHDLYRARGRQRTRSQRLLGHPSCERDAGRGATPRPSHGLLCPPDGGGGLTNGSPPSFLALGWPARRRPLAHRTVRTSTWAGSPTFHVHVDGRFPGPCPTSQGRAICRWCTRSGRRPAPALDRPASTGGGGPGRPPSGDGARPPGPPRLRGERIEGVRGASLPSAAGECSRSAGGPLEAEAADRPRAPAPGPWIRRAPASSAGGGAAPVRPGPLASSDPCRGA